MLTGGRLLGFALAATIAAIAAGCGGGESSSGGTISADGSSTVGPYVTAAAEKFRDETGNNVTVGISGTGGGFERFCRGETDLSNASRPIKDEEAAICEENDVDYVEFQVANDALTVVVNKANDWAKCLTVAELERDLGARLEGQQLERRCATGSRTSRSSSSGPAPTRARSTTSPT